MYKKSKNSSMGQEEQKQPEERFSRIERGAQVKDKDTSQVVKQKQRHKKTNTERQTLSLFLSVSRSHCPTPESPSWQATVLPLPKKPWDLSIVHDQPDWPPELNNLRLQLHIHTSLLLCCHMKKRQAAERINNSKGWCNISSIQINCWADMNAIYARLEARSTDVEHDCNRWRGESCDQVSRPYVGGQTAGPVVFRRPAISMCFGWTHGQWGRSHFSCSWYELRKYMPWYMPSLTLARYSD